LTLKVGQIRDNILRYLGCVLWRKKTKALRVTKKMEVEDRRRGGKG